MSSVPISLEVFGVQHGWASMNVRAGDAFYQMNGFSYVSDAFDDLARFGVDIALDAYKGEVIFDGEPSGWSWKFARQWDGARGFFCTFQIDELRDASDPSAEAHPVLSVEVQGDQTALAVLDALERVETGMGVEAFEIAWGQAFPVRGVAALRAALGEVRRPPPDRGEPVAMTIILRGNDE